MITNHRQFLDAIQEKRLIRLTFYSVPDSGTIDRECAPLDYGPAIGSDTLNRYWVWDPAATAGANPIGLLPNQIVSAQVLGKDFDPAALGVLARGWSVPRNWGTSTVAPAIPAGTQLPTDRVFEA